MFGSVVRRAIPALVLLTAPVAVLTPPASPPAQAAASRSAPRPSLDDTFAGPLRAVLDAGAVGVTVEVVDGSRSWRRALGASRLSPSRPASVGARFRAASVTKMLVSTLALQLVERGVWTLDTTLGDVLPRVWPGREDVTLRQLLSHTSGAPEYLVPVLGDAVTEDAFLDVVGRRRTDRELVAAARTQPWSFEPGTSYGYSNTNFVLVGMMLRRATGRTLGDLVERRVLRPARMGQSSFDTTPGLPAPSLREYGALADDGGLLDLSPFSPTLFSGAGALVSTVRDLDRFQLALSTGRLLRPSTVRTMRSVLSPPGEPLEYGLGSYRIPDPCRPGEYYHGHDGASFGTLTLSFTSADGRRRFALSMTGRQYPLPPAVAPTSAALNDFLLAFIGAPCGATGGSGGSLRSSVPTSGLFADLASPAQRVLTRP